MLWIFLLQLINSIKGLPEAEYETLCTSNACFTLNMDKLNFVKAYDKCVYNGGYLMTIRDKEEEDVMRSLLSQIHGHRNEVLHFWIGLKREKGNCVPDNTILRGFKWVSGEEDYHYSNWGKEPHRNCTKEKCVKIVHSFSGQNQLKWVAGPCKSPAYYACKFYFQGMCKPLALLGPGQISYTPPFAESPQRSETTLFPLGTYANTLCSDQRSYYSVCMVVDGIYQWTVPGPLCTTGKKNCMINNGGCEYKCHQDQDEVQCSCKEGYDLDEDGLSCRIKDLCNVDTCEHQCVMGESGYSCTCPQGFKLEKNQHNCTDIDECESQACEGHLCQNTAGTYTCVCKDGYELIHGECRHVDECARSNCEHYCLNNIGSFSCYCNKGFTLSKDGHSCADINECISEPCQFTCNNTIGSFTCTCPEGFHLKADGSTCSPDMTETSAPSSDDPAVAEETQEYFTESFTRTTVEFKRQSPHTDPPLPDLENVTQSGQGSNTSLLTSFTAAVNFRVIICILGSVIPLLVLTVVTMAIAMFRCNRSKKEAKKKVSTDGYCWVSTGLDPRLEKLYESILTDDL